MGTAFIKLLIRDYINGEIYDIQSFFLYLIKTIFALVIGCLVLSSLIALLKLALKKMYTYLRKNCLGRFIYYTPAFLAMTGGIFLLNLLLVANVANYYFRENMEVLIQQSLVPCSIIAFIFPVCVYLKKIKCTDIEEIKDADIECRCKFSIKRFVIYIVFFIIMLFQFIWTFEILPLRLNQNILTLMKIYLW